MYEGFSIVGRVAIDPPESNLFVVILPAVYIHIQFIISFKGKGQTANVFLFSRSLRFGGLVGSRFRHFEGKM